MEPGIQDFARLAINRLSAEPRSSLPVSFTTKAIAFSGARLRESDGESQPAEKPGGSRLLLNSHTSSPPPHAARERISPTKHLPAY